MFGLSAEATRDEGCSRSQGESYRIDRLFDIAIRHRLRLHSFTAGRRSLTGRQAVNLVVHRDVQQVNIPAHRMDEMISPNSRTISIASGHDHVQIVVGHLYARGDRERAAV